MPTETKVKLEDLRTEALKEKGGSKAVLINKNLNTLKRITDFLREEILTKEDFVNSFKSVVKLILKTEKQIIERVDLKIIQASSQLKEGIIIFDKKKK